MSDTSQGPGWWLASDGRWYPPELWTGRPEQAPVPASSVAHADPLPPHGAAPGTGAVWAYGSSPPALGSSGGLTAPRTNGLAVAALVCGIVGLFFVTAALGVVFGFVARSQIRKARGGQRGNGLALAGIIVGSCWLAYFAVVMIVAAAHTNVNGTIGLPAVAGSSGPVPFG